MLTNKDKYVNLCKNEPSICLYAQPWWLDVCCGKENWDVVLYEKKGDIIGCLPYYYTERYGIRFVTVPKRSQTCGFWIKYPKNIKYQGKLALEQEVMTSIFTRFEILANEEKIVFYQQTFPPEITNWSPLARMGYGQTTKYTYRINAGLSRENVWKGFTSGLRNEIKKASKLATIEEIDDPVVLYNLHLMTMERKKHKSSYSVDFIKEFDHACKEHSCRKILVAKNEHGIIETALYLAYDNEWVYYLFSGSDPQYRKDNFQPLLLAEAIYFACDTNRGFDFEGSMLPGVEEFVQKFGGIQTPFYKVYKNYAHNRILRAAINKRILS